MILTKDNFKLGLILGLIGPVVGLVVIYFISFSSFTFREFLDYVLQSNRTITAIGALSLLANAVIFAIYVNFDKYKTYKGIFLATAVYGVAVLLLKMFH